VAPLKKSQSGKGVKGDVCRFTPKRKRGCSSLRLVFCSGRGERQSGINSGSALDAVDKKQRSKNEEAQLNPSVSVTGGLFFGIVTLAGDFL